VRSNQGVRHIIKQQNKLLEYQNYPSEVLWLTYENFKKETEREMLRLLDFLGLEVDENNLMKALEFADFKNLQKMEKEGKFEPGGLSPNRKEDPNSLHVRKGKVSGYREELSNDDIKYIEKEIRKKLKRSYWLGAD